MATRDTATTDAAPADATSSTAATSSTDDAPLTDPVDEPAAADTLSDEDVDALRTRIAERLDGRDVLALVDHYRGA